MMRVARERSNATQQKWQAARSAQAEMSSASSPRRPADACRRSSICRALRDRLINLGGKMMAFGGCSGREVETLIWMWTSRSIRRFLSPNLALIRSGGSVLLRCKRSRRTHNLLCEQYRQAYGKHRAHIARRLSQASSTIPDQNFRRDRLRISSFVPTGPCSTP